MTRNKINDEQKKFLLEADGSDWAEVKKVIPWLKVQDANRYRARAGVGPVIPLQNRQRNINHDYFSTPTIENSYWAGLIAADGCIIVPGGSRQMKLDLSLTESDGEHVIRLADSLGGAAVYHYGPRGTSKGVAVMRVTSDKICSDLLRNFNITPKKSLTLGPPVGLTEEKELAFIAGYIDGDGCYGTAKRSTGHYPFLSILGTEAFLIWVKEVLCPESGVQIKNADSKESKVRLLRISGSYAIKSRDKLHDIEGIPFLERKRRIWEDRNVKVDYYRSLKLNNENMVD